MPQMDSYLLAPSRTAVAFTSDIAAGEGMFAWPARTSAGGLADGPLPTSGAFAVVHGASCTDSF
jgi:hypothetical protein